MQLWGPYGDPNALLLESPVTRFVLSMLKVWIPQGLLAMPLHCCGDTCDCTTHTLVFCIFHSGMALIMLFWCERGFRTKQSTG